jgi:hypothetical protein
MRKLFWLCLIAAAVYSGYWWIGARASDKAMEAWFTARQSDGWHAEHSNIKVSGYPLRFASRISDITLADPQTGTAFSTPYLDITNLSFAPTKLTANLAPDLRIATPLQAIDITNTNAQGTLDVGAGLALPLQHAACELSGIDAQSNAGWGFTLTQASLESSQHDDDAQTYDITFTAQDLAPSAGLMSRIDPNAFLSDRFDHFQLNTTVRFDKQWDMSALEGHRPQPRAIDLHNITAQWGSLELRVAGTLAVDERGLPTGQIEVKAQNWREMIALGIAAGAIPERLESILLRSGALIAGLKGNKETLDAELTLDNGQISFGFIPLGQAPRFVLR